MARHRGGVQADATPAGSVETATPAAATPPSTPAGSEDRAAAPPPGQRPRKATPKLIAQGLDGPERRVPLSYSAPSVDGDGAQVVGDGSAAKAPEKDGQTYPGTGRNEQCPCGSGKKYKVCHGKNEA